MAPADQPTDTQIVAQVLAGDLAITPDYRDVPAEIILHRLNNPHLEAIFPGYSPIFRNVVR